MGSADRQQSRYIHRKALKETPSTHWQPASAGAALRPPQPLPVPTPAAFLHRKTRLAAITASPASSPSGRVPAPSGEAAEEGERARGEKTEAMCGAGNQTRQPFFQSPPSSSPAMSQSAPTGEGHSLGLQGSHYAPPSAGRPLARASEWQEESTERGRSCSPRVGGNPSPPSLSLLSLPPSRLTLFADGLSTAAARGRQHLARVASASAPGASREGASTYQRPWRTVSRPTPLASRVPNRVAALGLSGIPPCPRVSCHALPAPPHAHQLRLAPLTQAPLREKPPRNKGQRLGRRKMAATRPTAQQTLALVGKVSLFPDTIEI